jgi:hypothetical protein
MSPHDDIHSERLTLYIAIIRLLMTATEVTGAVISRLSKLANKIAATKPWRLIRVNSSIERFS